MDKIYEEKIVRLTPLLSNVRISRFLFPERHKTNLLSKVVLCIS
jgi:hypothetical protein